MRLWSIVYVTTTISPSSECSSHLACTTLSGFNAPPISLIDMHIYIFFIPTYLFPSFSKTHTTPTQGHWSCILQSARTHQPHADPTPSSSSQPRDDVLALPRLHTWPSDLTSTSLGICTRQGQRCSYLASMTVHHLHPCVVPTSPAYTPGPTTSPPPH
ncbi:hypothetical protein FIBSPDRAFT_349721 [Athelia psychrophila]|uniref:Uncharacterized protein n=1 Tax=Athelia psychrophila TaxID=1759441 RepID=A0A167VYH2_9AGAM|nr:hypothetical protein FIBSPDRAFT_349721 [Fibularhizoctonia sp. CBS 109695]